MTSTTIFEKLAEAIEAIVATEANDRLAEAAVNAARRNRESFTVGRLTSYDLGRNIFVHAFDPNDGTTNVREGVLAGIEHHTAPGATAWPDARVYFAGRRGYEEFLLSDTVKFRD